MTKEQYLFLLRAELDGYLSPEEVEDIIRYYDEYFEDAGPERERDVMLELGSPQRLAEKILSREGMEEREGYEAGEAYAPYTGYNNDGLEQQMPRWALGIIVGLAIITVVPLVGGLVLGFGLGGIGCMIGGIVAIVVGSMRLGLAGKLYIVGGGLIAFAVGLLLMVAAIALAKISFRAAQHCWARLTGRSAGYDEVGY